MSDRYRKKPVTYTASHDMLTVRTPFVNLTVRCPAGLSLSTAKELIDKVSSLEFMVRGDAAGGNLYANSSRLRVTYDSNLPDNVIELRDDEGTVLTRITNVGKVSKPTEEDDEEI